jgi:uncharacterized protein (TIGR00255 family)
MTGFGSASRAAEGKTISAEIRSVNSKFLDLSVKMPSAYREYELELRAFLQKELERGKSELIVTVDAGAAQRKVSIDKNLFAAYVRELKDLGSELSLPPTDYTAAILRLPDVLASDRSAAGKEEWQQVFGVIREAVAAFQTFREKEGRALSADLEKRIGFIRAVLERVETLEPQRLEGTRQRLEQSLQELVDAAHIDRNRLEQEMIYYIEKLDISEEKVRLRSHCDFFMQTIGEPGSSGKKLSFISQEIGREVNTIGSKANHAAIQKLVVEMKDELEKIKEQLMNIL